MNFPLYGTQRTHEYQILSTFLQARILLTTLKSSTFKILAWRQGMLCKHHPLDTASCIIHCPQSTDAREKKPLLDH